MKDYIKHRIVEEALFILDTKKTVRQVAKAFGVSKSTVYNDVTLRLQEVNPELHNKVSWVLSHNKENRALRGGMATKRKYEILKQQSQEIENK